MTKDITTQQRWPATLKAGCPAFLDSFSGLVPVKVIRVFEEKDRLLARPRILVDFEITETVGAHLKGERYQMPARNVIPTKAIKHREFSTAILPYNIDITE